MRTASELRTDLEVLAELLKIIAAYQAKHTGQIEKSALTMMESVASPVLRESVTRLKRYLDDMYQDTLGRKAHPPYEKTT